MATITSTIKLVDQMTPTLNKISKAIDRVNAQSQNMGNVGARSFNNFSNGAKTATKHTHDLYNALRRAVFFIGTLKGLQGFATVADSMMNATARIDNINDGLHTTSEYMDLIYEAAQRSRGSFSQMATDIAKLGNNAGAAFNNSVPQMIRFSEILNKSFRVAGISAREASQASYQLTQALASGRLQGDEMRSILENSPIVAQKIADKLGVAVGRVRELGAEGKITSDVIVEAMFEAAGDIEKRFAKMPKTLGDIWTQISNYALNTFRPLIGRIQNFINSKFFESVLSRLEQAIKKVADGVMWLFDQFNRPEIQAILSAIADLLQFIGNCVLQVAGAVGRAYEWIVSRCQGIVNIIHYLIDVLNWLWNVILWVGNLAVSIAQWICDNWSLIEPIFWGVVTALVAYYTWMLIVETATWLYNAAVAVANFVTWLFTTTLGNFVLILFAVVLVIFLIVNAYNEMTGETVSAVGIIAGSIAFLAGCVVWVCQVVWYSIVTVLGFLNMVGQVCDSIINALGTLMAEFGSAMVTIYDQICTAIVDTFDWLGQCIIVIGSNIGTWFRNLGAALGAWLSTFGSLISGTFEWILACIKIWGSNVASGMSQLCQNLPLYWEYFKASSVAKFWQMVVALGNALNSMSQGARDGVVAMLKPFEGLVNGFAGLMQKLVNMWNDFVGGLGISILGQELWSGESLKINKTFSGDWTADGWVGAAPKVNIGGALSNAVQAHSAANSILGNIPEINWNTTELPSLGDYADWGTLGKAWEDGMHTYEYDELPENKANWDIDWGLIGDAFGNFGDTVSKDVSKIWKDFKNATSKLWGDLVNPMDWYNAAYEWGANLESGVSNFIDGFGSFIGEVFGDNGSKGDSEKPSSKDKDNLLDYDQLIKNTTPNVAPSLENLLDSAGGGGGKGGSGGGSGGSGSGKKPAASLDKIANATDKTANSTGNIEDTLDLAEEELELLRKLAEQEIINRFTTAEIHVDMTNNNNISSGMDLDGIVTHLSNKLYEELGVVASGVHY